MIASRSPWLARVPVRSWTPVRLGQPWVEVRPEVTVQAPVSVKLGLGSLPLSIGFFAGSGVSFIVKNELPKGWPRSLATALGATLAVAGVINLVLPQAEAAEGAKPAAPAPGQLLPPPSSPGQTAGGAAPYIPPSPQAFGAVTARIVKPADYETIDISPFAGSYPVRVEFSNPGPETVTFDLELEANESPNGSDKEIFSTLPVQVALGPGQVKSVDVAMPIASWDALVDFVDIQLYARKRSGPGGLPALLDYKTFVVE